MAILPPPNLAGRATNANPGAIRVRRVLRVATCPALLPIPLLQPFVPIPQGSTRGRQTSAPTRVGGRVRLPCVVAPAGLDPFALAPLPSSPRPTDWLGALTVAVSHQAD